MQAKQRSISFDDRTEKIIEKYADNNGDSFSRTIFKIVKKFIQTNKLERLLERN